MSRADKLHRQLLDGKQLSFREFESLLEAFGWELRRTRGSHRRL